MHFNFSVNCQTNQGMTQTNQQIMTNREKVLKNNDNSMLISTKEESNETEVIEFVASYFDFRFEKTEKKFYSDYPTLIKDESYHVGGLCAIIRNQGFDYSL